MNKNEGIIEDKIKKHNYLQNEIDEKNLNCKYNKNFI
jgi:hypothetical protein